MSALPIFPFPETEQDRPCSQCNHSQDRGDHRCERHGRTIVDDLERERLYPTKPTRLPKGHVQRSVNEGKRPFLTATVAPITYQRIDDLAFRLNLSRGRILDLALEYFALIHKDSPDGI